MDILARLELLAVLPAALALLGSAGATTAGRDPWAPLHRPVRLEPIAAGVRCPVSAMRVLVRGRRLDRPGSMRFQLGPQWDTAPLTAELRIDTTRTVGGFTDSRWGTTVAELLVRAHGFYGLQLDSERGTSTIVLSTSPLR